MLKYITCFSKKKLKGFGYYCCFLNYISFFFKAFDTVNAIEFFFLLLKHFEGLMNRKIYLRSNLDLYFKIITFSNVTVIHKKSKKKNHKFKSLESPLKFSCLCT